MKIGKQQFPALKGRGFNRSETVFVSSLLLKGNTIRLRICMSWAAVVYPRGYERQKV